MFNNIKDFRGIGKASWNLVLAIYTSGQNSLYMDQNKNLFKQKVPYMYTPKVKPISNGKKEEKSSTKLAVIERLPPYIPTKSPKEVKKISKYFKVLKMPQVKKGLIKSYIQALKPVNNTEKVLKIKDAFPLLKINKIDNIQKIINKSDKLKLQINMTTKGPLKKQVIILMNNENIKNFINESSSHILNLNRALKNIKSDVMVNFI